MANLNKRINKAFDVFDYSESLASFWLEDISCVVKYSTPLPATRECVILRYLARFQSSPSAIVRAVAGNKQNLELREVFVLRSPRVNLIWRWKRLKWTVLRDNWETFLVAVFSVRISAPKVGAICTKCPSVLFLSVWCSHISNAPFIAVLVIIPYKLTSSNVQVHCMASIFRKTINWTRPMMWTRKVVNQLEILTRFHEGRSARPVTWQAKAVQLFTRL